MRNKTAKKRSKYKYKKKQYKYKVNVAERVANLRQVMFEIIYSLVSGFPLKEGKYLVYNATRFIKEAVSVVNSASPQSGDLWLKKIYGPNVTLP